MEKAAAADAKVGGAMWEPRFGACIVLALWAACPATRAELPTAAPAELVVAQSQAAAEPGLRVQVQTSTLPRLEAQESGLQASRVDVAVFPGRPAAFGLGAVVGMSGFSAKQPMPAPGLQPQRPSFELGLRWSQRVQSQQVDITAWRRMNTEDDAYSLVQARQPLYGARIEMNLAAAAKSRFALDRGFLGFQLEGGGRISLKRKNGGPMVYYRTTF